MSQEFTRVECSTCSGHGVVDRGYHCPDECRDCGGAGTIVRYASGVYASYPGGPFLGREQVRGTAQKADHK